MFIYEGARKEVLMKKVLLFVFLFMVIFPVKGLENDLNGVRKYKYYRLNNILGPFVFKDEVNDEFPLIDEDNFIESDLSELLIEKPTEKDGREIFEYDGFHYLQLLKINNIKIVCDKNSKIYDIKINSKKDKVTYDEKKDSLSDGEAIIYNLNNEIDFNDFFITLKSGENDINSFSIYLRNDDNLVSEIHVTTFSNRNLNLDSSYGVIKENAYEDIYVLEKLDLSDDLIYKGEIKLYQYQDYKFQSYKLVREYYDEYLIEPFEDYIYRDEDMYIDVYEEDSMINNPIINKPLEVKTNEKKVNSIPLQKSAEDLNNEEQKDTISIGSNYEKILKTTPNKALTNNVENNNFFNYFKLFILIILLLLTIKLRNKVKEFSR